MDRYDIALLDKLSDRRFEFPKTDAQRWRLRKMETLGYVESRTERYAMRAGGADIELRDAFRRTPAGRAFLAAQKPERRA